MRPPWRSTAHSIAAYGGRHSSSPLPPRSQARLAAFISAPGPCPPAAWPRWSCDGGGNDARRRPCRICGLSSSARTSLLTSFGTRGSQVQILPLRPSLSPARQQLPDSFPDRNVACADAGDWQSFETSGRH